MRNRRNELVLEVGLVLLLAWLAARQGYLLLIAPRLEQVAALQSELADLRDHKAWGKGLRARLAASEAVYPLRLAALREIEGHFLHDENDRLRILDSWDRIVKQSTALRAQPDPGSSRTQAFDFRSSEPLADEASELRRKFSKLYPHDELPPWKAPTDSISVVRIDERLRLTGPFPEIFAFMHKIQSDTLYFEITHFSAKQEGAGLDEPLQATVAISAPMFGTPARLR